MRIINSEEPKKIQEETKEEVKEESKDKFNELLLEEFGNELYGINFFYSLANLSKISGLFKIQHFFCCIAVKIIDIKSKIEDHLTNSGYSFTYPQVNEINVSKDKSLFEQGLEYEDERLKHLYEVLDECSCECTKSILNKVIKKHHKIITLLDYAVKINLISEDKLLVQDNICDLLPIFDKR